MGRAPRSYGRAPYTGSTYTPAMATFAAEDLAGPAAGRRACGNRFAWSEFTILASWTETLLLALDDLGIDGRAMAREAGIDLAIFLQPGGRVPMDASSRLWDMALAATGDSCLGLRVSGYVRPTTFHGLSQAVVSSTSVLEALKRIARAARVVADVSVAEIIIRDDTVEYVNGWCAPDVQPNLEALDAVLASMVRAARFITDPQFSPIEMWLERPPPADVERYTRFFKCPIHFNAPLVRLAFDRAEAERQLRTPNPEMAAAVDKVMMSYLDELDANQLVTRQTRAAILQLLSIAEPTEPTERLVATQLACSTRSLQRRLHDEGTTFREVLSEVRREVAITTLRRGTQSVSELSHLLGFSHVGAFSRAFKRWTGLTPSAYQLRWGGDTGGEGLAVTPERVP